MNAEHLKSGAMLRLAPGNADINTNGHIFGGWILAQMDIAGGITAGRRAKGAVATVAIEAMKFHRPILIRDLVAVYTHIEKIGRTSITVKIDVFAERPGVEEPIKVTEGIFTFVAIDDDGHPRPVDEN